MSLVATRIHVSIGRRPSPQVSPITEEEMREMKEYAGRYRRAACNRDRSVSRHLLALLCPTLPLMQHPPMDVSPPQDPQSVQACGLWLASSQEEDHQETHKTLNRFSLPASTSPARLARWSLHCALQHTASNPSPFFVSFSLPPNARAFVMYPFCSSIS